MELLNISVIKFVSLACINHYYPPQEYFLNLGRSDFRFTFEHSSFGIVYFGLDFNKNDFATLVINFTKPKIPLEFIFNFLMIIILFPKIYLSITIIRFKDLYLYWGY